MSTNFEFYLNTNSTPVFEIGYENGERYFLMPFRKAKFQVSMSAEGLGSAGGSSNMYFDDARRCMSIGMNHCDKYWVEGFDTETIRKVIIASAREAIFDHFHTSYGNKHIEEIKDIVSEVYRCNRETAWNRFIVACFEHFGVKTEWDD